MKRFPFIIHSIFFIIGILTHYYLSCNSSVIIIPFVLTIFIITASYFFRRDEKSKIISKMGLLLLFFFLGNYLHALKVESRYFLPEQIKSVEKMIVMGTVQSIDLTKDSEITLNLKTDSIRIENSYQVKEIYLLCKIRDDSFGLERLYDRLLPGYKVRIEGSYHAGREAKNPGEFDYNYYLRSKGISGLLYVNDDYEVKIINWDSNVFQAAIFNARKFIDYKLISLCNSRSAGLLRGLLLADRSKIDYETKTEFVNSGVMHILAVSGLHVGYIVLIFVVVLGRFNILTRSILTITGLILFLLLTGMPASVFRAVTMAVVIILGYVTNRTSNIFNSLAIAAFIVLIVNAEDLFNPGFQLSFLAVLSIAVIYPFIQRLIYSFRLKSKIVRYILLFMGVSLSAQIGTLPLTFIYFGKLSLISLITNLIVIPLAGLIVGIAIFTLVLSIFLSPLAVIYAAANDVLISCLFKVVGWAGNYHYAFIPIKNFTFFDSIIFYCALILIIYGLNKLITTQGKIIFIVLVIMNAALFNSIDNKNLLEQDKLNIMAIDVSRGNAAFVSFPNGQTALINGGYATFDFDNGNRIIFPLLDNLGVAKIDYAFVSNMNKGNYGGLISLMKKDIVNCIVKSTTNISNLVDVKFDELAYSNKIPIEYFEETNWKIGGVKIYFLTTEGKVIPSESENLGRTTIIKIVYKSTSFLFYCEVDKKLESIYFDKYKEFLESDVLVVSNSEDGSFPTDRFMQAVNPKISLISSGNRNKFDKVYLINLERFKKSSIEAYQTHEGAVLLQSDGSKITKVNWK